ncbi:unnamed protein product [Peniophora sp. CBMAI 1063]|nr:unnamed protein product [Peniophora sp. CBMAI 1063]
MMTRNPVRQGSSSYPNLRQSLVTGAMLSQRPHSINLPSPTASHYASSLQLPRSGSPNSFVRANIAELSADHHRAQARAEVIEADARSERRIGRSRAPGRSAVSGSVQSRSPSRQLQSRHSSRARLASGVSRYPSSATSSRISLAPAQIGVITPAGEYRTQTPVNAPSVHESSSSSAPGIRLEPPSPEQGRRRSARKSSDMIDVKIQPPSSESLQSISDRYASPSPTAAEGYSGQSHMSDRLSAILPASDDGLDEAYMAEQACPLGFTAPEVPPGHTLDELVPREGPRYTRQVWVQEDHWSFEVPPLSRLDFPHSSDGWSLDPDLQGWEPVTHPEGGLYFCHRERRVFTEAYLYNDVYMEEVELLIDYLNRLSVAYTGAPLPSDCDLVIQVTHNKSEDDKRTAWHYYLADHETRSVFWLRPFQAGDHLGEVYGDVSPAHFKHLLESWYWDHVSMLPDNFQSHDCIVDELVGDLTYHCVDHITSPNTTVPYTLNELTDLIRLLGRKGHGTGATSFAAALARIMAIFCHWRFVHYHGQRSARLDRLESVRDITSPRPRTWLMQLFSFLFLFAPEVHLRDMEKVYVDGIVTSYLWKRHISKLQGEWEELIAYATIILTASVSMLSVPDVILFSDNPNPPGGGSNIQSYLPPLHSPAAIASYVSIICSIGSIVLGLMLVHHNRTKNREDSDDAAAYMKRKDSFHFHHEPLAILYSLPYALLMWSMLSFATSVVIFTLDKTDIVTQSTVALISFGVSCLTIWCVIATWETEDSPRLDILRHAVRQMAIYLRGENDNSPTTLKSDGASQSSGVAPRINLQHVNGVLLYPKDIEIGVSKML